MDSLQAANLVIQHQELQRKYEEHQRSTKIDGKFIASHLAYPTKYSKDLIKEVDRRAKERKRKLRQEAIIIKGLGIKSDLIEMILEKFK
jgi:hypothetical protein